MLLKLLIGAGIGALIGGVLGSTRSCETGGCPLTANPTRGAVVGGLLGLMLATSLTATGRPAAATVEGPSATTVVSTLPELTAALAAHEGKALVVFTAPWCPSCRSYAPEVETAARTLGAGTPIFKVDTDKSPDAAAHYGVKYLPTSVLVERGKEKSRFVGSKSSQELLQMLEGGSNER